MVKKAIGFLVVVGVLVAAVLGYGTWEATRLPDNTPGAYLGTDNRGGNVVVCIGDSITHGRVSHNYVDELDFSLPSPGFTFINAGINSELAYNVLQRIDTIIACKPDYITILIGTNDMLATLNDQNAARYVKQMKLPQTPDFEWYKENLTAIVDMLQQQTTAKIALLSLPLITEDRSHIAYQRAAEYSEFVRQLAGKRNLVYLPLNELMDETLSQLGKQTKSAYVGGDAELIYSAVFSRYILKKNWDDIAEANGFIFLTDNLHLSRRGARVVADLASEFLLSSQN